MKFGFLQIVNVFGIGLLICILQLARLTLLNTEHKIHLTQQEMQQDLENLLYQVEQHSAFSALNQDQLVELKDRIEPLLFRLSQTDHSQHFYAEITKLLAKLDDPGMTTTPLGQTGYKLPISLRVVADKWLALDSEANFIDQDHPYITHIDGIPMARWEKVSKQFISAPQQQSISTRLHWLSQLSLLRYDMGLPNKAHVLLTLTDHGDLNRQLSVPVAHAAQTVETYPVSKAMKPSESAILPAYISITDLSEVRTDKNMIAQLKHSFKQPMTVLDLRMAKGNNGELLTLIANEYANRETSMVDMKDPQRLIALGQYKRSYDFKSDFLRPLGFIPFEEFDFFEQVEFTRVSQSINLPENNRFGLWYGRRAPLVKKPYRHTSTSLPLPRLALLIGPECRGECEWIAYFAKSLDRVTLVGEKTSGDLGRRFHFTLPNSGINIHLTASLTYDMQGKLLSSMGTKPDIPLSINEDIHWQGLLSLLDTEEAPNLVTDIHKDISSKGALTKTLDQSPSDIP